MINVFFFKICCYTVHRFERWSDATLEVMAKKWLEDVPALCINQQLANYLGYFKDVHSQMCCNSQPKG